MSADSKSGYQYRPQVKAADFYDCVGKIKNSIVIGCVNNEPEAVKREIAASFKKDGHSMAEYLIDAEEYKKFLLAAGYGQRYPHYYTDNFYEKTLEHYLTVKNLQLKEGDIFIDIASEHSPLPDICQRVYGANSFRQDIMYLPGISGDRIGGDACSLPVPGSFADKVALTCSFEHFEGDSDSRLLEEIGRVLRPGGRAYIVPLYLYIAHAVQTDPAVSVPSGVSFDEGATVYCVESWGNRHARFYDSTAFKERLSPFLGQFTVEIQSIGNLREIDKSCYARFALLLTKKTNYQTNP
ncbi:MAG: class I SAM-dependent methyltransferase [Desulfocucumaceae bacterium]